MYKEDTFIGIKMTILYFSQVVQTVSSFLFLFPKIVRLISSFFLRSRIWLLLIEYFGSVASFSTFPHESLIKNVNYFPTNIYT